MPFGSVLLRWLPTAALAVVLTANPARAEKTLVFCSEAGPETFNPQLNVSGNGFDAARPVYDRLVDIAPGTTELRPGLAESWTVTPDGLIWEFKLRRNVAFHATASFKPSRPFNADDVVFSFDRMLTPGHPYHGISGGRYTYFEDMGFRALLKGIERVDDHIVRFHLRRPDAPFVANLAMDFAAILSKEYGDAMMAAGTPEQLDRQPIGTGPFVFAGYDKDRDIRFTANDSYWDGRPRIDRLVFAITPDAGEREAGLKTGACHIAPYPTPSSLPALAETPGITILSEPGLNVAYLAYNTQKPPFDSRLVRQALTMAINKNALVQAVYGDTAKPAVSPLPPAMWSHDDTITDYPYDPEQAKALLTQAGVVTPVKTDLWAFRVQRPYNPDALKAARLIQADLARVGFEARIVSDDWTPYRQRCQDGEHQMCQMGWTADSADPDNILYTLLSCDAARPGGSNIAKWCYRPFDDLVTRAQATSDRAERASLYAHAQKIVHEEAPWFVIAHAATIEAVSTKVLNYRLSPLGIHDFRTIDLAE